MTRTRTRARPYQPGEWRGERARQLNQWNPLDTPSAWMTAELWEALDAIPGPHKRKKRITVLRLAEADARGQTVTSVFDQEDTCAQQAWYGTHKGSPKAWQNQPEIKAALTAAKKRAHWWYDQEEARRMEERQRLLADTQDELVDMSRKALQVLSNLMANSESDRVQLDAAESVLNRADQITAIKSVADHDVTVGRKDSPSMADIRSRLRNREPSYQESQSEDDRVVEESQRLPPPPPVAIEDLRIINVERDEIETASDNGSGQGQLSLDVLEPTETENPESGSD